MEQRYQKDQVQHHDEAIETFKSNLTKILELMWCPQQVNNTPDQEDRISNVQNHVLIEKH